MNPNLQPRPPFEKGNKFGKGRKPGSRNKKTIERTEAARQHLEDTNFLVKMANQILSDYENGNLKPSEAAKAFDVMAKYMIKTTAQDQDDVVIDSLTRNDAEQVANTIRQRLEKMLPEPIQEDDEE